jgi:hypothetical protein
MSRLVELEEESPNHARDTRAESAHTPVLYAMTNNQSERTAEQDVRVGVRITASHITGEEFSRPPDPAA